MNLTTCCLPDWEVFLRSTRDEQVAAASRVLLSFARLYEVALWIRDGAKPSRLLTLEKTFLSIIHQDLARCNDIALDYNPHDGCQICSLNKAIRMVARSAVEEEVTAFILKTSRGFPKDVLARINFDWSRVFQRYERTINPEHGRTMRRFSRAIEISQILYKVLGGRLTIEHVAAIRELTVVQYPEAITVLFPPVRVRPATPKPQHSQCRPRDNFDLDAMLYKVESIYRSVKTKTTQSPLRIVN